MIALPPLDPDQLHVEALEQAAWDDGYEAAVRDSLPPLIALLLVSIVAAAVGFALAVAFTPHASAASRSAASLALPSRAPLPELVAVPEPPSVEPIPPPAAIKIRGTATWYCASRSACTHGYGPSDLVAAIDPTLGIPKGTQLTVSAGGRSVTVRVVDLCACRGPRVIDLTSGAFKRLAPLSAGILRVTISTGGPMPTAPGTDSE